MKRLQQVTQTVKNDEEMKDLEAFIAQSGGSIKAIIGNPSGVGVDVTYMIAIDE